jgi:hypothetical protein
MQHRKKRKECSIANIILQATNLFLFFQSNVVFHISIVKTINNNARKTTIKEFLTWVQVKRITQITWGG